MGRTRFPPRTTFDAATNAASQKSGTHVLVDTPYERPSEVDALIGDASKAQKQLGWKAPTYGTAPVDIMVDVDRVSLA